MFWVGFMRAVVLYSGFKALLSGFSRAILVIVVTLNLSLIFATRGISSELFIFSINDLHGYAEESKSALGFAKFITGLNDYKKSLGATEKNAVVVAAGDLYQGGFLSNISHGDTVSPFLKSIGVRLSALGNHDLDWGISHLKRWEKDGGFEFLSSNVRTDGNGTICKPYKIIDISGYKVAFVGFTTTESAFTIPSSVLSGIGGLLFDNPASIASKLVKEIRTKHSPNYVIALTHIGAMQDETTGLIFGEEIKELSNVEGIDAIIAGHTHSRVAGFLNGKAIVEACSYGKCVGTLKIDTSSGSITPVVKDLHIDRAEIIPDLDMQKSIKTSNLKYEKEINTILATASTDLTFKEISTYFVKKIFDKYATEQKLDAVIINGGLFRTKIANGDNISYKTVRELIPFDNTLVFAEVSGVILKKAMHHTHNMPNERKEGAFYTKLSKIKPDMRYKIAISSFMYPRGDWYDFRGAENVFDTGTLLADLLAEFVNKNGI